jgi:hypothetical protein
VVPRLGAEPIDMRAQIVAPGSTSMPGQVGSSSSTRGSGSPTGSTGRSACSGSGWSRCAWNWASETRREWRRGPFASGGVARGPGSPLRTPSTANRAALGLLDHPRRRLHRGDRTWTRRPRGFGGPKIGL